MSYPQGAQPDPVPTPQPSVPQQPTAPEIEQVTATPPAYTAPAYNPAHAQPFGTQPPPAEPVTSQPGPAAADPAFATSQPTAQYQVGTAAVPGPDTPVSATPGYAPISAAPYGYGYGAPTEPPAKKRTSTIVLSIVTGVLALVAAGMTTMYFVEHTERTAADKTVTEQTAAIAANEDKIEELDGQLKTAKEDFAKLEQELEGSKNKTDEVTKEREALANCFRAMEDYLQSRTSANEKKLETACDEASKYY